MLSKEKRQRPRSDQFCGGLALPVRFGLTWPRPPPCATSQAEMCMTTLSIPDMVVASKATVEAGLRRPRNAGHRRGPRNSQGNGRRQADDPHFSRRLMPPASRRRSRLIDHRLMVWKTGCDRNPVADVAQPCHFVAKSSHPRLPAPNCSAISGKGTIRSQRTEQQMAKSPATPQQGGSSGQPQQQQGQQAGGSPQQAGQPIFKDWASI